jgi:hypothetical protein
MNRNCQWENILGKALMDSCIRRNAFRFTKTLEFNKGNYGLQGIPACPALAGKNRQVLSGIQKEKLIVGFLFTTCAGMYFRRNAFHSTRAFVITGAFLPVPLWWGKTARFYQESRKGNVD